MALLAKGNRFSGSSQHEATCPQNWAGRSCDRGPSVKKGIPRRCSHFPGGEKAEELPPGARIGTSSLGAPSF